VLRGPSGEQAEPEFLRSWISQEWSLNLALRDGVTGFMASPLGVILVPTTSEVLTISRWGHGLFPGFSRGLPQPPDLGRVENV